MRQEMIQGAPNRKIVIKGLCVVALLFTSALFVVPRVSLAEVLVEQSHTDTSFTLTASSDIMQINVPAQYLNTSTDGSTIIRGITLKLKFNPLAHSLGGIVNVSILGCYSASTSPAFIDSAPYCYNFPNNLLTHTLTTDDLNGEAHNITFTSPSGAVIPWSPPYCAGVCDYTYLIRIIASSGNYFKSGDVIYGSLTDVYGTSAIPYSSRAVNASVDMGELADLAFTVCDTEDCLLSTPSTGIYPTLSYAPKLDALLKVTHANVDIYDGDTVYKKDFAGSTAFWDFTFNWPHPVQNNRALFVLMRGEFGDLEGGVPLEGVNNVMNIQAWSAGTTTITKAMGYGAYDDTQYCPACRNYVSLLGNASTTSHIYTAMVAELQTGTMIDYNAALQWFTSGGTTGTPPLNHTFLTFNYIAEPASTSTLSYASEEGFAADAFGQGVHPNKGTAGSTSMVFKVVYTGTGALDAMNVFVGDGSATTSFPMIPDMASASTTLQDGIFTNGEQYVATGTFPKGTYQYYFEAQSASTTVRLPADSNLTFQTGYSNVAFLPGIKASRLYQEGSLFENQLWEPNTDADVEKLLLDSSGNSVSSGIYTRDVIDQANIIPSDPLSILRQNFYLSFIRDMNMLRDDGTINDWKALPYDWRLDYDDILESGSVVGTDGDGENISYLSATSSPYIIQEIERLAETSANGKVTIVAHSNGGLLAKKLIDKLETKGEADLIENLILVASPQLGTPKAIASLLHGYKEDIPKDFGFFTSREIARQFGQNLIPGYNLLPSSAYMDRVKDVDETGVVQNSTTVIEFDSSLDRLADTISFRDFWGTAITTLDSIFNYRDHYGNGISTAQKLNEFLRGVEGRVDPASDELEYPIKLTSSHIISAESTHELLDIWEPPQDSGITVYQIAGWGLDTIRGIKYVAKDRQVCTDNLSVCDTLPVLDIEPLFTSDGDRVVVTPSATAMSTSTYPTFYVNIFDYNKGLTRDREHADILEIESVLTLIKNIVKGESTGGIEHVSSSKPERRPDDTSLRLALHSPVSVNIYDSFGNHTGVTLDEVSGTKYVEEQIPNSYYLELGEGKYLGLDTSDEYRIELEGEDFGTFTFEIQEMLGDEVLNSVEYVNIPVSPTTRAEFIVQTLDTTPELSLDIDGDGITDATFTGTEENDVSASIGILKNIINGLDMHKGLKKELIKKLEKTEKELKKGKIEKATKPLDEIIKKLGKEIKENLEMEDGEEEDGHKEQKKEKGHNDERDDEEHDDDEKISTEDARMLVGIVESIKSLLI